MQIIESALLRPDDGMHPNRGWELVFRAFVKRGCVKRTIFMPVVFDDESGLTIDWAHEDARRHYREWQSGGLAEAFAAAAGRGDLI